MGPNLILSDRIGGISSPLYLVEIPIQCSPQHHRYLPCGRRCGLEVHIARIRDGGYEEVVTLQRRIPETVDMASFSRQVWFTFVL